MAETPTICPKCLQVHPSESDTGEYPGSAAASTACPTVAIRPETPEKDVTTPGQKILAGLREAVIGNFSRVTIGGQVWVRHDADSPEHLLVQARQTVADLNVCLDEAGTEITRLRSELAAARAVLSEREAIADAIATRVAELPDRTSPDWWPEAMLVTANELHSIVTSEIAVLAAARAAPAPESAE